MARPRSHGFTFALLLAAQPLVARAAHAVVPAAADAMKQAKAVFDEAEKAYALGHFEEALKGYERAYELQPLPAFLYNIGQCEKHLGHWERAGYSYQGYLARTPRARNRAKVLLLIEEVKARQKAEAEVAPVPPPGGRELTAGSAAATQTAPIAAVSEPANRSEKEPVKTALPEAVLRPPESPRESAKPLYKRWWVWTAAGVVVVGAAVGGIAGYSAANPRVSTDALQGSLGAPVDATH